MRRFVFILFNTLYPVTLIIRFFIRVFISRLAHQSWKDIPVNPDTKLQRFGAIANMMSLSSVPVSMVGPADDNRIHVEGYIEMATAGVWLGCSRSSTWELQI